MVKDMLGNELTVGDYVAYAHKYYGRGVPYQEVFKIGSFTPKGYIRPHREEGEVGSWSVKSFLKDPTDRAIKLSPEQIEQYLNLRKK